jgi:hypothetical protein
VRTLRPRCVALRRLVAARVLAVEISDAAYDAIATSSMRLLMMGAQRSPQGGYFFWLDEVTLNKLTAARGPSEDLSDVLTRIAKVEAGTRRP